MRQSGTTSAVSSKLLGPFPTRSRGRCPSHLTQLIDSRLVPSWWNPTPTKSSDRRTPDLVETLMLRRGASSASHCEEMTRHGSSHLRVRLREQTARAPVDPLANGSTGSTPRASGRSYKPAPADLRGIPLVSSGSLALFRAPIRSGRCSRRNAAGGRAVSSGHRKT